jgi:hypothetical protein
VVRDAEGGVDLSGGLDVAPVQEGARPRRRGPPGVVADELPAAFALPHTAEAPGLPGCSRLQRVGRWMRRPRSNASKRCSCCSASALSL